MKIEQDMCDDCCARSLEYDFSSAHRPPVGRCGSLSTELSYSDVCALSGGELFVSDGGKMDERKHVKCTASQVDTTYLHNSLVGPSELSEDSVERLSRPGVMSDPVLFCGAMNALYSIPHDHCLIKPFG